MSNEAIVIYTKNNCQPCRLTKAALTRKGIHFEERNIEENDRYYAEVEDMGYTSVPVVKTWNDEWAGLRPDKIATLS